MGRPFAHTSKAEPAIGEDLAQISILGRRPAFPHPPLVAEPLHELPKWRKQILCVHENSLDFFTDMSSHEIHFQSFIK
ncbi:hypothetical protein X765_12200 [Mesorhizobium sp. LSHC440B00]|nr:hypothetical protein X765_12200 [Mesorhizobium sp. LSHC440B00]ESX76075.1 hypothetical protein X757_16300 [Mesorhizobium sp. LSHC414A00]